MRGTDELMNSSVAVVLLTCNQKEHTLAALGSIKAGEWRDVTLVLVDNASADDTCPQVCRAFPEVLLIRQTANVGCAAGRNIGIRAALQAEPAFVMLLDNDCLLAPDAIGQMVRAADAAPEAGLFTPKVLWWHKKDLLWGAGGRVDWERGRTPLIGYNQPDTGQFDQRATVDYAPGGFTMIRAELARTLGAINEQYFIYYEDPDWCIRAGRMGTTCQFVPEARVWHNASQSVGGSPAFYFYRARNRPLFMKRNAPHPYRRRFWRHYWRDTLDTYYLLQRTGQAPQARAVVQGVRAYFRQQWGAYPGQ
jgi:GT2 family glycosyltransferase